MNAAPRRRRTGFSLIEVSLSTLLVGLMLVASVRTVGSVLRQRARTAADHRATLVARQLIEEILAQDYKEPTETATFGPEASETSRGLYDDVDDYHNLDQSPPLDRSGFALAGFSGWRRRSTVQWVDPANVGGSGGSLTDQGVKRVTVEVYEGTQLRISLQTLKTDGWPE